MMILSRFLKSKPFIQASSFFFQKLDFPFLLASFLMGLILFPLFYFFSLWDINLSLFKGWEKVILSTLLQAMLSALFSLAFGIIGALGLCHFFEKKNYRILEIICSLPALLPPLVVILAWFNVLESIGARFSFSNYFVIFFHVCIYTGMISVFMTRVFVLKFSSLYSWAYLHKISSFHLFKTLMRSECKKEILLLFLLVFSFCFTSFSVPLLVGGDSQNVETVMAEKLKNPSTWGEAFFLFSIESLMVFFLFILVLIFPSPKTSLPSPSSTKSYFLKHFSVPIFLVFPLLPAIGIGIGLLEGLFSFQAWRDLFFFLFPIFKSGLYTFAIGLGTGFFTLGLLSAIGFCIEKTFLRRFLISYFISSTVFLGFSFLLILGDSLEETLLKTSLGLSILFLPSLFKGGAESVLSSLKTPCQVANQMGAGAWLKFSNIIWPKCAPSFFLLSGMSAFWACGDFALSSIVIHHSQKPLALLIQDLFSTYRLELAILLIWLMMSIGILCALLFWYFPLKLLKT